jgi:hypothetical protein
VNRSGFRGNILFVTLLLFALLLPSGCLPNKKFSAERWRQAKAKDRQWMADNFLQTVYTTGMSLDELTTFLGTPDYPQSSVIYYLDSEVPPLSDPLEIWSQRPVLRIFLQEGVVTNTTRPESAAGGSQPFDATRWKTSPPSERLAMCNSLLRDVTVNGMAADEVELLLGRADEQEVSYDLGVRLVKAVTLTFIIDRDRKIICAQTIEQ